MRVAIPKFDDRVSPVFDSSTLLLIADLKDGKVDETRLIPLTDLSPFQRVDLVKEADVDVLICASISCSLSAYLTAARVRVIDGVVGEINAVLDAFLAQALPAPGLDMPGCRRLGGPGRGMGRGHGCGKGRGQGGGMGRGQGGGMGRGPGGGQGGQYGSPPQGKAIF